MKKSIPMIIVLVMLAAISIAQDKLITAKDYTSFVSVGSPTISPDGSRIIYSVRTVDLDKSRSKSKVMIKDLKSGNSWQFLNEEGGRNFRWNKAADTIAFVRKGQVWTIPSSFGEASQLTSIQTRVADYRWLPCGKKMLILSREARKNEKEYKKKMARKDDGYVVDSELFRDQFYTFDLASGKAEKINDGHPGIDFFDLSPDGTRVVYSTNYTGKMDDDLKFDLWVINLKNGLSYKIADLHGPETSPVWSPDGKTIAFMDTTEGDVEYAQSDITLISPQKDSIPKNLTAGFDRSVNSIQWRANGYIYATVSDKTETPLFRIDPAIGKMEKVDTNGYNPRGLSFSRDNKYLASSMEKYPELSDIQLINLKNGKMTRVTNMSAQLEGYKLPEQKVISWKYDGVELEAIVTFPVGYKKGNKYPTILHVHGGPYGRVRNSMSATWQVFAANGYAVVAPNYRGGVGYGDAFGKALRNDFGGVDYLDSMSAVDEVIRLGIADPEKLAVTGGSWGGYLTNWTITQTDRFKAAVSLFGIWSFKTDMSNSRQPGFEKMYFGGHYWEGNPRFIERAPQTHGHKVVTPVLIMHGEIDTLTFVANSNEMYTMLKFMGKVVEYVKFPREGHGFREPNHRIDYINRSVKWFDKYLK